MKGTTHLAVGCVSGIAIATQLELPLPTAGIAAGCCMVASLLPDLDSCTSLIGRRAFPVSSIVQLFFGHRTALHAPLLWLVLLGIAYGVYPQYGLYIAAAGIGILTHLGLDILNPAGVPLFWPVKKRYHLGTLRSGGIVDRILGSAMVTAAILLLLRYFTVVYMDAGTL